MPSEMTQIDSTVEVVTPENIAFHYQVAGPFRRLPAFLLDVLIRAAAFALVAVFISFIGGTIGAGGMSVAVIAILWFLSDWFYGGICETVMNGQTFGKRTMGIRVLTVDGQPINGVQAVMRNFLRSDIPAPTESRPRQGPICGVSIGRKPSPRYPIRYAH